MIRIAVMTSGGDAQGMNAAVRAVVRSALNEGAEVFAIREGYSGLIAGGKFINQMRWESVGGVLHKGGTIIGSARCLDFKEREGRMIAVRNLIEHGISRLVVIGGDGSLTGADLLRREWTSLVAELLEKGEITQTQANECPYLAIAGLVGSIDNDMWGTDITIGADSALHRICYAVDAISSTAASHQRAFVIEVMGRRSGYLALMAAIASGADWALIPESPPNLDAWEDKMCKVLKQGREAGRRDSIVIVAEGATDRYGKPITAEYVRQAIEDRLKEDVRVTILGHVQRGGAPSAFDRILSTVLGDAAVKEVLNATSTSEPMLLGWNGTKVTKLPLMECVHKTHEINKAMHALDFNRAMDLRGQEFKESFRTLRTLVRALPHPPIPGKTRRRFAVLNAGAPSPGMNTAVRATTRIGVDKGHYIYGVFNGFQGLIDGNLLEFDWMSVNGWALPGGSELGTNRKRPQGHEVYSIARTIEQHKIEGLIVIGGWSGFQATFDLYRQRSHFPAFNIPMIYVPAGINNNLPGTEISIGPDTALNSIAEVIDKIKQSAVASRRCFVVEVMGKDCGYLALASMLATGAEQVYLPEEGVTLADLQEDIEMLKSTFKSGKRLAVMIRNEHANPLYTTKFIADLFEEEGRDLFEVRWSILGHLQQGGNPTPIDRVLATRFGVKAIEWLEAEAEQTNPSAVCVGQYSGEYRFTSFDDVLRNYDAEHQRPKYQWWTELSDLAHMLGQPGPGFPSRRMRKRK
ncbi:MAG: 6-phosphofructokinase [Caldilineaceae bacterium]